MTGGDTQHLQPRSSPAVPAGKARTAAGQPASPDLTAEPDKSSSQVCHWLSGHIQQCCVHVWQHLSVFTAQRLYLL